ncbi:undecaprenyl-diphosphate phosphatase [Thermophilibacter provencensis]|uniref:Undecaprenyl-diphosphatase n=1 Tax=Thermophilibacter provencensis TaxID=1852386 RepID=A0ABT7V3B4_9ACTN|nr:undecaprenyl-diphosphate phosphatase [Thermophilibacter provencensis]MDM8271081.1 undecaprenyl-diphosphate phosphatase [Thermophilibacter provencensis]
MDFIELVKAAVFGIVEGITEWLPISSTGHMLLLNQFLTMNVSKDFWNMFLVVIQLGAILAVCVMFFHRLNPFSPSKSRGEKRDTWLLWAKTIVACIPAAVIGIPIDDWMEANLGSPFVIAAALIVYGIAFIVIETVRERRADRALEETRGGRHFSAAPSGQLTRSELADADARVQTLEELDWKTAIGIGLFQVLSIVPGTSRSGSTIIGGLILGCKRTVVAEFTFFLAIPVMVGASGLRLVKFFLAGNALAGTEAAILGVGCLVAFVVSLVVIKFLMEFVRRHDFKPFGWYRIVLGVAVIAWFALH